MTDLLFTPIRLDELETLIEHSVERALKAHNQKQSETQLDNPLCLKEAAKLIGKREKTLYGYVRRREIPFSKKGNRLYFFKSELIEWLKLGKQKTLKETVSEVDEFLSNKNKGLK